MGSATSPKPSGSASSPSSTALVCGAQIGDVGALIESPAFYPALTGSENLRVLAIVAGHDIDRIPALLELVGLDGRGDDRYRSYSFGMKQRLGIAAAMLGDPKLLSCHGR
jgi:ABC-2 type transport system ATP-binding protein